MRLLSKELSRLADPDGLDLEDCVPAYLLLYDKKTEMYRCYHADISDVVVLDNDPVNALTTLIDVLSKEVNHEQDELYN